MKSLAVLSLLVLAAPSLEIRYFRFERPIVRTDQSARQTCMVIDASLFSHAAQQLADLRLYQDASETPYILRSNLPAVSANQSATVLNPGTNGNQTVFDVEMPSGSYSDLELDIDGHDFLATITVSGSQEQAAGAPTELGSFTIFDFSQQRLGRSTILHLPESNFHFLHFKIAGPLTPKSMKGLAVTRLPAIQPKYVTVAATQTQTQKERESVFEITVPAHIPVDRIVFSPTQDPQNFSRDVEIRVAPTHRVPADESSEPPQPVTASGNILRIHSTKDGHRIDEEHLAVNAPQASLDGPATWIIAVQNRDDAPIQMASVRLEMVERDLCFDAKAGAAYTIYYGDAALGAPQYDYAALFSPQPDATKAQLGSESQNPAYQARPDERPFTEMHPVLLWTALVLVIVLLGAVAFRSFKEKPASRS